MGILKLSYNSFNKLYKFYKILNNKKISLTEFINESIKSKKVQYKYIALNNYWYEVDNEKDLKYLRKSIKNFIFLI